MEDFFDAFEDGDAEGLAVLFSAECGDMTEAAAGAIDELREAVQGQEVDFVLVGVDIQNLEEDSAEVLPNGSVYIRGQQAPLAGEDEEYTALVKEDGEWKIADCALFE